MKVLLIHTSYKFKGGEDDVVFNELELLRLNGVTADLFQFSNKKNTFFKFLQLPFNVSSYIKTRKKLRSFKPDIVHVHNLHFGGSPAVIAALKKEKVPFVLTLHNYRLLCPSATLFNKGEIFLHSVKKQFSWKAIYEGVFHQSKLLTFWVSVSIKFHHWMGTWDAGSRYIVLSKHSDSIFRNSILKLASDRIIIKPNFCYAPKLSVFRQGNYYLYVGRLTEEKGIMLLLNTFASLKLPLKIVGSGPLEEEVEAWCLRFSNIEYQGFRKREDVLNLLMDCNALVFPSLCFETFGMVIIEAFSTGTTVIASRRGSMLNTITDKFNGLHFEPGNKADLIEKINTWEYLKEEEKEVYRKNARLTYEQYSPEKNAKQLISIYTAVLEEGEKRVMLNPEKSKVQKPERQITKLPIY